MIKIILLALGIVFSMLGFAEFIHGLRLSFIAPKKKAFTYSVILLNGENPVSQLSFVVEQMNWLGKSYADNIIAVNAGLSSDDDKACKYVAEHFGIIYCTSAQLKKEFGAFFPDKNELNDMKGG